MLLQFDDAGLAKAESAYPEFRELKPILDQSASGLEFVGFDLGEAMERLAGIRDMLRPETRAPSAWTSWSG